MGLVHPRCVALALLLVLALYHTQLISEVLTVRGKAAVVLQQLAVLLHDSRCGLVLSLALLQL